MDNNHHDDQHGTRFEKALRDDRTFLVLLTLAIIGHVTATIVATILGAMDI